MNEKNFAEYKNWYDNYYHSFKNEDGEVYRNILLKYKHTLNVCGNISEIAKDLNLVEEDIALAKLIALFHDLGRFEQFKRYKTFSDGKSVNHSQLALDILKKNDALQAISENNKNIIYCAIMNHNSISIDKSIDEKSKFFAKLIRDADKLDIYRIFSEYYKSDNKDESVALHLKKSDGYSKNLIEDILAEKTIKYENLIYLNDFKLLKLSWLFDINFNYSFNIILKNNYINMIYDELPKDKNTQKVFNKAQAYLLEKSLLKN